jgi:hypothetical protein
MSSGFAAVHTLFFDYRFPRRILSNPPAVTAGWVELMNRCPNLREVRMMWMRAALENKFDGRVKTVDILRQEHHLDGMLALKSLKQLRLKASGLMSRRHRRLLKSLTAWFTAEFEGRGEKVLVTVDTWQDA